MEIKRLTPQVANCLPPMGEHKPAILSEAIYLDTETSHISDEFGWIYQWAFSFMSEFAFGRKPSELLTALEKVEAANNLGDDLKCVIFIHNLSYDIQYLKQYLLDRYGRENYKILAIAPHKFITFEIGPWIFRCTYRLSNRSLDKWGRDLGIKNTKKKGLIDYNKVRYQDSLLYKNDWKYMLYDVLALEECVKTQLLQDDDTLQSMPLTSTGYVRRDARRNFRANYRKNRKQYLASALDVTLYKALHSAFAGGLTHGNRFVADTIVSDTIGHGDFVSHYPSQQMARAEYPTDKFALLYKYKSGTRFTLKDIDQWSNTHCLIIQCRFTDLEIKKGITLPYAQSVKFWQGRQSDGWKRIIDDNGRILHMEGSSIVSLTEYDLKWIRRQYTFRRCDILRVWSSPKGPLPEWLKQTVKQYFYEKTALGQAVKAMNAVGDYIKARDLETSRGKAKNRLNGVYGMTATNPVRAEIYMDQDGNWDTEILTDEKITQKLADYYDNKNTFMSYQFGVYCTALARDELMQYVELIGYDNFLYADTDSIFFRVKPDTFAKIKELNDIKRIHAEEMEAYIESNGERVYFDCFDLEERDIQRFKFLHAKAYAYEHKGQLHCTIAGVAEHGRNNMSRVKELGSLEELKENKVFVDCGGTSCVYLEGEPRIEEINGHMTEIASAAIILESTKTLHGLITKDEYYITYEEDEDATD